MEALTQPTIFSSIEHTSHPVLELHEAQFSPQKEHFPVIGLLTNA
jgi:hypothetical protein